MGIQLVQVESERTNGWNEPEPLETNVTIDKGLLHCFVVHDFRRMFYFWKAFIVVKGTAVVNISQPVCNERNVTTMVLVYARLYILQKVLLSKAEPPWEWTSHVYAKEARWQYIKTHHALCECLVRLCVVPLIWISFYTVGVWSHMTKGFFNQGETFKHHS